MRCFVLTNRKTEIRAFQAILLDLASSNIPDLFTNTQTLASWISKELSQAIYQNFLAKKKLSTITLPINLLEIVWE